MSSPKLPCQPNALLQRRRRCDHRLRHHEQRLLCARKKLGALLCAADSCLGAAQRSRSLGAQVRELQRQGNASLVMALTGNKADLSDKRKVEVEVRMPSRMRACRRRRRDARQTPPLPGGASVCGRKRPVLHGDVCKDGEQREWCATRVGALANRADGTAQSCFTRLRASCPRPLR